MDERRALAALLAAVDARLSAILAPVARDLGALLRRAPARAGVPTPAARRGIADWLAAAVARLFGATPAAADGLAATPGTVPHLVAGATRAAARIAAPAGGVPDPPALSARLWRDPNGHALADRLWLAGEDARSRLVAVLDAGIARGTPPADLARELSAFLAPGVAARDGEAAWAATRLARHETARAYDRGVVAAARGAGQLVAWRRSVAHRGDDICDRYAAGGPYRPDEAPDKPHPLCACYLAPVPGGVAEGGAVDATTLARAASGY